MAHYTARVAELDNTLRNITTVKRYEKTATLSLRAAGYTAAAPIAALDFLFRARGWCSAFFRWRRWLQRRHEVLRGGYQITRHDANKRKQIQNGASRQRTNLHIGRKLDVEKN